MTTSTDAILVYGINFGEEFPVKGLQDNETVDYRFEKIILGAAGVKEPEEQFTRDDQVILKKYHDFWAAKRAAEAAYPLELVQHCHSDYAMYILALRGTEIRASRGDAKSIEALTIPTPDKIEFLKQFCVSHDLEYTEPKWLLCSYWG